MKTRTPAPTTGKRLRPAVVAALDASRIVGVRAGARSNHRFIGVWVVVVEGRAFARSWERRQGGWYRTFLEDPRGTLQIGGRNVRVRAVRVTGDRLRDAVEDAYAAKYPTAGSLKYVRGFRSRARRETTIEFVPPEPAAPRARRA